MCGSNPPMEWNRTNTKGMINQNYPNHGQKGEENERPTNPLSPVQNDSSAFLCYNVIWWWTPQRTSCLPLYKVQTNTSDFLPNSFTCAWTGGKRMKLLWCERCKNLQWHDLISYYQEGKSVYRMFKCMRCKKHRSIRTRAPKEVSWVIHSVLWSSGLSFLFLVCWLWSRLRDALPTADFRWLMSIGDEIFTGFYSILKTCHPIYSTLFI